MTVSDAEDMIRERITLVEGQPALKTVGPNVQYKRE